MPWNKVSDKVFQVEILNRPKIMSQKNFKILKQHRVFKIIGGRFYKEIKLQTFSKPAFELKKHIFTFQS